ncbi:MAG: DUF3276 family protein [Bacteroidota bacterium]
MEDGYQKEGKKRDEIFSKSVRAGKRTYFFDVKTTRGSDLYITITESKKRFEKETNKFNYEKHKIFLYKEDFEKFVEGLNETVAKISELKESGFVAPESDHHQNQQNHSNNNHSSSENFSYTNVEFEDLDK